MSIDWQEATAIALVGAASIYLIRRLWRTASGRQTGSCNSCDTCVDCEEPDCRQAVGRETPLSLDPPTRL